MVKFVAPVDPEIASRPNDDRELLIQHRRWVSNPASEEVFEVIRLVAKHAEHHRPRCYLIWAPPNAGKSTIARLFIKQFAPAPWFDRERYVYVRPVVLASTPTEANEARLYDHIIQGMELPELNGNVRTLWKQVRTALTDARTRTLLLDDLNNLNIAFGKQGSICLAALRNLTAMSISIVAFGTPSVFDAIASDEQLSSRFRPVELRPLERDEFDAFAERYMHFMPLRSPSEWTDEMLGEAYAITSGYVGRLSRLIEAASVAAVQRGLERVTLDLLTHPSVKAEVTRPSRSRR